jgi:hypothetical protein
MKTPTILILREFRQVCSSSKTLVDFENDQLVFDQLKELKKRTDLVKIRALIYAAANCSEGESKKALLEFVGVDLLLSYPVLTIRALDREKLVDQVGSSIVEAGPVELSGVSCATPECQEKRKKTFLGKRKVLETAKIRKIEEPVRNKLLSFLKSDS